MQARSRQLIIAHRGASGYLPEHTQAGKALAYAMGADYLEQDVVATADGQAIVLHDRMLDFTTDVRERFPNRARRDGYSYALDFTWAEISQLRVSERCAKDFSGPQWPNRFPTGRGEFRVVTLAAELAFIQEMNRQTGRNVGAYIEIKNPDWHREEGVDLSRLVLQCLEGAGLADARDQVFLQCFHYQEIKRLRQELGTALPLIQLLRPPGRPKPESDFQWLCSEPGLTELADYVDGIGPYYEQLVEQTTPGGPWEPTALAQRARSLDLLIHAHTFRADDLPANVDSFEELLQRFLRDVGVDGIFCDFPDQAVHVRDTLVELGRGGG